MAGGWLQPTSGALVVVAVVAVVAVAAVVAAVAAVVSSRHWVSAGVCVCWCSFAPPPLPPLTHPHDLVSCSLSPKFLPTHAHPPQVLTVTDKLVTVELCLSSTCRHFSANFQAPVPDIINLEGTGYVYSGHIAYAILFGA